MDVLLALLAAVAFAVGNVFQQIGTLTTSDGERPSELPGPDRP